VHAFGIAGAMINCVGPCRLKSEESRLALEVQSLKRDLSDANSRHGDFVTQSQVSLVFAIVGCDLSERHALNRVW
jgi:hypothetical protein